MNDLTTATSFQACLDLDSDRFVAAIDGSLQASDAEFVFELVHDGREIEARLYSTSPGAVFDTPAVEDCRRTPTAYRPDFATFGYSLDPQ
jgi:hypothetical protein